MHYESSSIRLNEEMLEYFFKKRTTERDTIFKIFARTGSKINLERKKYQNCIITFHFTNSDDMIGEIKKYLEYSAGRSILSYMKTMMKYLIEERKMEDFGHFCVVVEE